MINKINNEISALNLKLPPPKKLYDLKRKRSQKKNENTKI